MDLVDGTVKLTRSGRSARVARFIGEGSQGAVYEAQPPDGRPLALKWYHPAAATAGQRRLIEDLVDRGAPDDRFLWPLELVERDGSEGFGYVMPLRSEEHAGLTDLLTGKVDVPFSIVCRLGVELADAFLRLHGQGLCYRDISFSNVFFRASTGVPLICDNDNVGIDGASRSGVLGTRRFMAPEIVRRESSPSAHTDLYSLSVLLFYILMMGHPLMGRRELDFPCWDEHAESEMFGTRPLFVFDPSDPSNAADPETHAAMQTYWGLYPSFLQKLFVQAFTRGLSDPRNGRVRESIWRSALARLLGCIARCPSCRKENVFDDEVAGSQVCWSCARPVPPPLWLQVNGSAVALGVGSTVVRHHLDHRYDLDERIATVVAHPVRADLLGLQNLTPTTWTATLPDGEERDVEPGRSVRVEDGVTIDLSGARAVISLRPRA